MKKNWFVYKCFLFFLVVVSQKWRVVNLYCWYSVGFLSNYWMNDYSIRSNLYKQDVFSYNTSVFALWRSFFFTILLLTFAFKSMPPFMGVCEQTFSRLTSSTRTTDQRDIENKHTHTLPQVIGYPTGYSPQRAKYFVYLLVWVIEVLFFI